MAQAYGWRSFWWLNTGLCALAFVFVLVGFPETKYNRVYPHEVQRSAPAFESIEKNDGSSHNSEPAANTPSNHGQDATPLPNSHTSNDSHLGTGKPNASQWKLFQPEKRPFRAFAMGLYLPFKLLCFPIIVFASFIVSFSSTCYLMITFIQSQAFAVPPYSFNQQLIGFMNFASLIGALLGLLTAGRLSDWVSAKLTQRNNGIREPEMRLLTMIPYVAVMLLGNFVVAFGLQNDWDWRVRSPLFVPQLDTLLTLYLAGHCHRRLRLRGNPDCGLASHRLNVRHRLVQARCRNHLHRHHH